MARSIQTDPFQNFRFHLIEEANSDGGPKYLDVAAGFVSINLPNITLEMAEYKTGLYKFKRKFPGPPTIADVSLTQGIFRVKSPLYEWVMAILNGGQSYRRDLTVYHYHIQDKLPTDGGPVSVPPSRIIVLRECWPTDLKPNPDFEANSADVSLSELTLACEQFEIREGKHVPLLGN